MTIIFLSQVAPYQNNIESLWVQMASREAQAVRPVSFLEHVIYWRTYFVSARAILTANVFCKITFAFNSRPLQITAEFTHNEIILLSHVAPYQNNIESLWVQMASVIFRTCHLLANIFCKC